MSKFLRRYLLLVENCARILVALGFSVFLSHLCYTTALPEKVSAFPVSRTFMFPFISKLANYILFTPCYSMISREEFSCGLFVELRTWKQVGYLGTTFVAEYVNCAYLAVRHRKRPLRRLSGLSPVRSGATAGKETDADR